MDALRAVHRWVLVLAAFGLVLAPRLMAQLPTDDRAAELLAASKNGQFGAVDTLLKAGIPVNAKDPEGCTALHLAAGGGHQQTSGLLIQAGADVNARDNNGRTPLDMAIARGHGGMAEFLRGKGGLASPPESGSQRGFHPDVKYADAASFSKAIGEPAVMLDSERVAMLVPQRREEAARIVLPYLTRAYDELYRTVGVHTKYKMLVYAYPKGFPGVRGGTSGCVIKYDDANLDLQSQPEWKLHRVPHVSGYIEEMAHNFVHATGAEFGWEMVGWNLSATVTQKVAPNPIWRNHVDQTRRSQEQSYRQYVAGGYIYPAHLPADTVDRIHSHLLRRCELQYGVSFWPDFFAEVRKEQTRLFAADAQGDSGPGLDQRYRITVECFDRLKGLGFRKLLAENHISTEMAIQSLKPAEPGWNRKLE